MFFVKPLIKFIIPTILCTYQGNTETAQHDANIGTSLEIQLHVDNLVDLKHMLSNCDFLADTFFDTTYNEPRHVYV